MDNIEITHTTPSKILIRCGVKTATILGEALTRLPNEPDFVLYADSLKSWHIGMITKEINLQERNQIIQNVLTQLTGRGWRIEVEE